MHGAIAFIFDCFFFFFSSRRRHTRWPRDWSSDVCSSDLVGGNTASNYQFMLSDTTKHFLRGALYFDVTPNVDSIRPVLNYLKEDMEILIRSEEHTSELQSRGHLVCRILLEKKKIVEYKNK